MEHKIEEKHFECIEILLRHNKNNKKFIIKELEKVLVGALGENNELEFTQEIQGFDKIRVNEVQSIEIHYNKGEYKDKNVWAILSPISDSAIIEGILKELEVLFEDEVVSKTAITSF